MKEALGMQEDKEAMVQSMCLWGDIFLNIPVKAPSPLWTQSGVQNGDILLSETWV